jgi:hypothetical protein
MLGFLASVPLALKVTISLATLLILLLHKYFTKYFNYWKDKGVPYENPVLLFGSVSSQILLKEHILHYAQRLYRNYEAEPFIGYFQGRTPILFVKDLDLIKNIFVKDFSHFVDHGFQVNTALIF